MAIYSKRIQTMLTEEQYETLLELARRQSKPVSILVREAIEHIYFTPAEQEQRQTALANLLALDAPVASWEQMEAEISQGAWL
jgi:hypothetical protein